MIQLMARGRPEYIEYGLPGRFYVLVQSLAYFSMKNFKHEDDEPPEPNWPAIRDLFAQYIEPAKSWEDADCLGELHIMAAHFCQACPNVEFTFEDLKLALYDLNISYERNEHNGKFYYLAKWK